MNGHIDADEIQDSRKDGAEREADEKNAEIYALILETLGNK